MLMCGGDGLADIIGRRFGKSKLPWAQVKSWVGSMGMLVGGWVFAVVIALVYVQTGIFPGEFSQYILPLTIIAVVGTLVESLPLKDIDNITVTAAALILGHLLF